MQDSYEKIKIALPEDLLELIDRDAESFDFFKKDKSVNRNGFVNALLVAYFDAFRQKEAEERAHLLALAKKSSLSEKDSSLFIDSIIAEGYKGYVKKANYSASLSFRPTKESIYIISHIESNLLKGSTLSDYFRRMLFAYGSLPQFRREAIVFKDVYKKASKAIEDKKQVYVYTANNAGQRKPISPYGFAVVAEETYNYLLYKEGGDCRSFRLSKIKDIIELDSPAVFDEVDQDVFRRLAEYGPQYSYSRHPFETEIVLTEKGQSLFKKLYVYRPKVERIEDNHYFFRCSLDQLEQYFRRFGAECQVIKPETLRQRLIAYYKKAYQSLITNNLKGQ